MPAPPIPVYLSAGSSLREAAAALMLPPVGEPRGDGAALLLALLGPLLPLPPESPITMRGAFVQSSLREAAAALMLPPVGEPRGDGAALLLALLGPLLPLPPESPITMRGAFVQSPDVLFGVNNLLTILRNEDCFLVRLVNDDFKRDGFAYNMS